MFFTLIHKQQNSIAVLEQYVKKLNISVSPFTIKNDLQEHPDYPSLLAVSDCLLSWKIPHEIYKIDKNEYKNGELIFPFIAHLNSRDEKFILVNKIQSGEIHYGDEHSSNQIMKESDFLETWDGIILFGSKSEESGEPNYKNAVLQGRLDRLRLPLLLIAVFLCVFAALNYTSLSWTYLLILIIKLCGVVVSTLLLIQTIDSNNPLIQKLCNLNKTNGCDAILKSDSAKVSNWLSWSEVGMFYFTGSFLCLLLVPNSSAMLGWLSVACLPYTVYSINYQIRMKSWCVLCCTVQGLLWLDFIAFVANDSFLTVKLQTSIFLYSFSCFLIPIAVWAFLKPFMIKSNQVPSLKRKIKKIKFDTDLFNYLLKNQPHYAMSEEAMPILLGNPVAKTTITFVSSPFCPPCAKVHKILDEWLTNRLDLQLQMIFTTDDRDDDGRTKVARHLSALSSQKNETIIKQAVSSWYADRDKKYTDWAKQFPVVLDKEMDYVTKKHNDWCDFAKVTVTPTLFINGYRLPELYSIEDLEFFIS